jgi:hypothetical protein
MIRGRRLFWIFGLDGYLNRRVLFAVAVEAEVGDKVFAHEWVRATRSIKGVRFWLHPEGLRGSTKRKRWEGDIRDKEESSIVQHCSNGDFDWPLLESKFGANPV